MVYAFCMTTQAPQYAIMRIEKRKDLSAIRRCAAHHLRTVHTPNANPERGIKVLAGPTTDAEVVEIFKRAVGPLKRRKDATLCLDVFIGASPSFFASGGSLEAFEANAMAWAVRTFGADNIVCAVTHDDESTPHVQLLLAPITKQGRLSASHWIDGPKRLPKRTKKPTRRIIGAAEYDAVLSPLELIGAIIAAVLPPEVQAIMLLVMGLIDGPPSVESALVIGQIQAMLLDMYMRGEQVSREDGTRFKSSIRRALSP